ncbi:MAG: hypothetical protein QHD01_37515 [Bradyrhizobium sp.]|nr:hypothetical protein [Bradyrhizobium sp.]MDX3972275.1 hypothetical protein [Bradyrhizobium sp.]
MTIVGPRHGKGFVGPGNRDLSPVAAALAAGVSRRTIKMRAEPH